MLSILFVDHVGVLGGAELSLLDIARHFRGTSRVVLFEDGPFREALASEGVAVSVLAAPDHMQKIGRSGGLLGDLKAAPAVLQQVGRLTRLARRYDVLYANSQKSMIVAALAGLVARRPVIWHLRDVMSAEHFSPAHQMITTLFGNHLVTRIIANSDATRHAFIDNGGYPSHIYTVHNGLDLSRFEEANGESDAHRSDLRAELGVGDVPLVGVFSRLAEWKGQHILIDALQHVPEAHAVLVGSPLFREDKQYAQGLRARAEAHDVAGRVHFLGFRNDVPELMQAMDIVAHTSIAAEPFGRVIVEGMLAHKPVIATRAGGATEIVQDGISGLLVPPGDARALARALNTYISDPDQAAQIATQGHEHAREHFTLQAMLHTLTQHMDAVATSGR